MDDSFIKTTNAVYRVLDGLPDGDPLRNRAKERVLIIMENLTLVFSKDGYEAKKNYLPDREKMLIQLIGDIEISRAHLSIARAQGWIEAMNFLIIEKEYQEIKNKLLLLKGLAVPPIRSGHGGVDVDVELTNGNQKVSKDSINTVQAPDRFEEGHFPLPNTSSASGEQSSAPLNGEDREINSAFPEITERQQKILTLLKKGKKNQVADILKELPGITKITIRRDLGDLLKKGKVVRLGEWNQVFYQVKEGDGTDTSDRTFLLS